MDSNAINNVDAITGANGVGVSAPTLTIKAGTTTLLESGGEVSIQSGVGAFLDGGDITLLSTGSQTSGDINIQTLSSAGDSGDIILTGGQSTSGQSGSIILSPGPGTLSGRVTTSFEASQNDDVVNWQVLTNQIAVKALQSADIDSESKLSALVTNINFATDGSGSFATGAEGDLAATALQDITGEPLSDLSDVTITTIGSNEVLKWSGSA